MLFFRRYKKTKLMLVLVVAIVAVPYLYSRWASTFRRIQIYENSNAASQESFDGQLTVATYNIAHGRGLANSNWAETGIAKWNRMQRIADLVASLQADVVVLNEVDFDCTWSGSRNQAATIAELAGYPFWVEQRNLDFGFVYGRWSFGNAVLSKYPIAEAKSIDFPPYRTWEDWLAGSKRGIACKLKLNHDRFVNLFAVHLEYRSEQSRVESAVVINQLTGESELPCILAGDLNTTPVDYPQANRTPDGENAFEVLMSTEYFHFPAGPPDDPNQLTFRSDNPRSVIDWILIPQQHCTLQKQLVIDSHLSDHRAVVAQIEFKD